MVPRMEEREIDSRIRSAEVGGRAYRWEKSRFMGGFVS